VPYGVVVGFYFSAHLTPNSPHCIISVSVIFLVFVGIVTSNPPVFVHNMSASNAKNASGNAFVVAILYLLTFFFALFMSVRHGKKERATKLGLEEKERFSEEISEPLVDITSSNGNSSSLAPPSKKKAVVQE
jgi:high-affinity K+ transport system ATPase subunit B